MKEITQFRALTAEQRLGMALHLRDVLRRFPETAHNLSPETIAMTLEILDEIPDDEEPA